MVAQHREIATTLEELMKRMTSILAGLLLSVLFGVASANAQSGRQTVTANIPFEFSVGNISFPAGQYKFVHTETYIYEVRNANGRTQVVAAGSSIEDSKLTKKSRLRFANVDGRHVLVQIWDGYAGTGNDFAYRQAPVVAQHSNDKGNPTGSD
jgi:hypothetical protein